jgi:hypothetical protein
VLLSLLPIKLDYTKFGLSLYRKGLNLDAF